MTFYWGLLASFTFLSLLVYGDSRCFPEVSDRPGIHVGLLPCLVKWQQGRRFGIHSLTILTHLPLFHWEGVERGGFRVRVWWSMDPLLQRNFLSLCSVLTQNLYWLNFILGKKTCFFFCFAKKRKLIFFGWRTKSKPVSRKRIACTQLLLRIQACILDHLCSSSSEIPSAS